MMSSLTLGPTEPAKVAGPANATDAAPVGPDREGALAAPWVSFAVALLGVLVVGAAYAFSHWAAQP